MEYKADNDKQKMKTRKYNKSMKCIASLMETHLKNPQLRLVGGFLEGFLEEVLCNPRPKDA